MRNLWKTLLSAFFAVAGMAAAGSIPAGEEIPTLYLYCQADSLSGDCVADFEARYGCRVDVEEYESYEAMYEAVGSGHIGYDLIVASCYVAKQMDDSGMLDGIDHRLLPNLRHLGSRVLQRFPDPGMTFHVPYAVSIMGVGYDRRVVDPGDSAGWDIFSRGEYGKRAALFGDARLALGAALKHLGLSANTADRDEIARAGEVLREWKERSVALFSPESSVYALESGSLYFVQTFNGDMARLMQRSADLEFFVPGEGSIVNAECFVIPADAADPDLAHAFINHMLEPAVAAMNMEDIHCYMPNPDARALLPAEITSSSTFKVPYEVYMASEPILDMGEDVKLLYDDVWLSVLIGK